MDCNRALDPDLEINNLRRRIRNQIKHIKYLRVLCAVLFAWILCLIWFCLHQENFPTGKAISDLLTATIPSAIPIFLGFAGSYFLFFKIDDDNDQQRLNSLASIITQRVSIEIKKIFADELSCQNFNNSNSSMLSIEKNKGRFTRPVAPTSGPVSKLFVLLESEG